MHHIIYAFFFFSRVVFDKKPWMFEGRIRAAALDGLFFSFVLFCFVSPLMCETNKNMNRNESNSYDLV